MIYSILMLFYILQFWTLHRYLQRKWRSTSSELQSTSATWLVIPLSVEVWSFRLQGLFLIFSPSSIVDEPTSVQSKRAFFCYILTFNMLVIVTLLYYLQGESKKNVCLVALGAKLYFFVQLFSMVFY